MHLFDQVHGVGWLTRRDEFRIEEDQKLYTYTRGL